MESQGRHIDHSGAICHNSAIARLLVNGNNRETPTKSVENCQENEPPLDLSFTRKKSIPIPDTSHSEVPIGSPLKRRSMSPPGGGEEKRSCVYCPFVAKDSDLLYSHYQYHRQIMTTPLNSSMASFEWMQNYQRERDTAESVTPAHSPGVAVSKDNASTLRSLLQPSEKRSGDSQTASKYLKSIVQNIIKHRTPIGGSCQSSRASSRPLTPLYGSRGSSRMSSPNLVSRGQDATSHNIQPPTADRSPHIHQNFNESLYTNVNRPIGEKYEDIDPGRPRIDNCHVVSQTNHMQQNGVKREFEESGESETSSASTVGYETESGQSHCPSQLGVGHHQGSQDRPMAREHQYNNQPNSTTCSKYPETDAFCGFRGTRDAFVQCELSVSREECQVADSVSSGVSQSRCQHCGITFDDEVIFSIHMGCHNHKDPFICNVCGRSCENKYAFYTHIMRGHEYS